jgi:uncharacterized membrane-anchored protein
MRATIILSIGLLLFAAQATARVPQNEQERDGAVKALRWRSGEVLTLPSSQGTLSPSAGVAQLLGHDAVSLWEVLNGVEAPSGTEAVIADPQANTLVFFQKLGGGYVRLDDWEDVDADAMLKAVSERTEESNVKRRAAGMPALHVVGWIERPHLDKTSNTVGWSFDAMDEANGPLVNNVALVLGRDGFEKLTWIGPKSALKDGLLKIGLSSFSFPSGGRYSDFRSGDTVAEYGVAGLIAGVLGVKIAAKVGLLAAIALFAKKFAGILIFAGMAFLAWLRRFAFGRKGG